MVALATFLLLALIFQPSQTRGETPEVGPTQLVFYITPDPDSFNPDCPHFDPNESRNTRYCVTIDNFTRYELPDITSGNSTVKRLDLVFLEGTHVSSMPIEFTGLDQVRLLGLTHNTGRSSAQAFQPKPLIQLLAGNISVHAHVTKRTSSDDSFVMKYLRIDGNSNYTLRVITSGSQQSVAISVDQVEIIYSVLQVLNGVTCPFVTISNTSFVAGMFEWYGCLLSQKDRNITIMESTFQVSKNQPYAIAICPHLMMYYSNSMDDLQNPAIQMHNLRVYDLDQNVITWPSVSTDCSGMLSVNHQISVVVNRPIEMTVTNSSFNGSYGAAIQSSVNCRGSTYVIMDSYFTGYTDGVFVFIGDLTSVKITLINTLVAKNSISTEGAKAAGLTVVFSQIPTLLLPFVVITNCTFQQNDDHVRNLQIVLLQGIDNVTITNSKFIDNSGTAIRAMESNITFAGDVVFANNTAWQGGALSLTSSIITLSANATMEFVGNRAIQSGGAIFIEDCSFYLKSYLSTHLLCFYQPAFPDYDFTNTAIKFYNNSAGKGGDLLFGTSIRNYCKTHFQDEPDHDKRYWDQLFNIDWSSPMLQPSIVSSKAMRVCLCDSYDRPQCTETERIFNIYPRTIYSGEVFTVNVALVGAEFGTTTGEIYAQLLPQKSYSSTHMLNSFHVLSGPKCTPISFAVLSNNRYETLYLTSSNISLSYYGDMEEINDSIRDFNRTSVIPYSLLTAPIFINITLDAGCPRGFTKTANESSCQCYKKLSNINVTCTFVNSEGVLTRGGSNWIGIHDQFSSGIVLNSLCSADYCNLSSVSMNLDINNGSQSDLQCVFNRSGSLCGGCKHGYSLAIGSSHCLNCTDDNNVALVLVFATAGPLLYMVIAALDLTITRGSINGLIFYANIVWVYQTIVFTSSSDNAINTRHYLYSFKVFIAWLNLDFGIETCFFRGLDSFWKSLLQYIFPLYILFIAWFVKIAYGRISVQRLQEHYPRLAKITGNPVNILTTFVFLSYTKLLRTIVAAFAFAKLTHYPQNATKNLIVWAVDGNLVYFSGRHIVVFTLAFITLIFTLLYTIYVFLAGLQSSTYGACQCSSSHTYDIVTESGMFQKCCKLLDMPLPLRDSHFLPLKNEHRYWFGVQLLTRVFLLVIFSVTYLYPQPNLLILMTTATVLLFYMGWKKVYNKESVWTLEGISLSNLIFLSGGLLSSKETQNLIVVFVSLSVAFVQFAAIIVYHIVLCCCSRKASERDDTTYNRTDEQSAQSLATGPLSTNEDVQQSSSARIMFPEQAEDKGFRDSILLLVDESEPLIQAGRASRWKYFDCCRKRSHRVTNLNYSSH